MKYIKFTLKHQVVRGVVESLKIITRQASLRVAEYAFHYAKANGRQRVSAIHKANIMRKTDGLFLKVLPSTPYSIDWSDFDSQFLLAGVRLGLWL